ncbi:hypothetical protein GJ496_011675 [Pomphorhynchus laevis]|nr:hypothetical protein GJ496_011675 [Pomphorhynchus laevis]
MTSKNRRHWRIILVPVESLCPNYGNAIKILLTILESSVECISCVLALVKCEVVVNKLRFLQFGAKQLKRVLWSLTHQHLLQTAACPLKLQQR